MLGLSANLRYFLCCSTIDMRNDFDGLAGIVRNQLKQDPISGYGLVFITKPVPT
jgi:transposase